MKIVQMQKEPIDVTGLLHKSGTVEDGAILTFIGTARKNSMGREVHYLHYDVYEDMAMRELDKIVKHAVETWPLTNCIVIHRYGRVNIGEASVFIAVSVKHREEGLPLSDISSIRLKDGTHLEKGALCRRLRVGVRAPLTGLCGEIFRYCGVQHFRVGIKILRLFPCGDRVPYGFHTVSAGFRFA